MVQDTSNPNAGADPFDMEEADPSKTDAQSSSLWELRVRGNCRTPVEIPQLIFNLSLQALCQHYHPTVSRFCKIFDKPINPLKEPYEVKDFLGQTYETVSHAQSAWLDSFSRKYDDRNLKPKSRRKERVACH